MSSLFWPGKKASWLLLIVFLAGCQSLRTREDIRKATTPSPGRPAVTQPRPPENVGTPPPIESDEEEPMTEVAPPPPPAPVIPSMPKIGLILGGGGAKTYAHVGFLH